MSGRWNVREPLALIGDKDVGKTSFLLLFSKFFRVIGMIEGGKLGGNMQGGTDTLDFLNFSYKGKVYTLYGTGGDRKHITDYYRRKVINKAGKFILIMDANRPVEEQVQFLKEIGFTNKIVMLCINKVDLVPAEQIDEIKAKIVDALKKIGISPLKVLETVAIEKDGFEKENKNVVKAVLEFVEN